MGSPATSFNLLLRQPLGAGVSATNVTTTYDVTVTGTTTFDIAAQVGTLPLCVDGPGQAPPQKH